MVNDYLMGMLFKGGDMGAALKSIQQGIIEINGGASYSHTINEVDINKSICLFTGSRSSLIGPSTVFCTVELLSSTIIRARRSASDDTSFVGFLIIEFLSGIASSQRGYISIGSPNTLVDKTINEVDVAKAFLGFGGYRGYEGTEEDKIASTLELVNSTTLRATRGDGETRTAIITWDLLEFK